MVYGEWKTGENIRAFTMALLVLPIKIGLFFRGAIIAVGLIAIGFVANQDPAPEVAAGIRGIMTFAPAVACAIGAVIFSLGYKIEDKNVVRMQDEIAARKAR